ncbi:MAG: PAS domain-containing protein, partial [bacterium]
MNRYETILKSIGDAVIVTDGSGAIELMNPAAEALTGWSDKEAKGKPVEKIFRIINEETKVGLESPVARVLREGTVIGLANHTLLIARDGKVYAIADSGAPIYDEPGGKITGVVLVFRDQTRERAAQRALDEAHKFAENIIATVREPLLVLDGDLKIITANKAFYRTFKVKKKATEGKLIYDLGNRQWDIPQLRELLEDILPKNTSFENYKVEHDFETIGRRTMLLNARRIKTEAGKDQFILLAIEDISERFRLEEQYRQAQKLEAVALLAGGVAHDFNNLLTVILGYGETIIRALHKDDPLRKDIGEILSAGEQGSSLTQQLLAFSRKQTLQPKILNLNKIVGNLQKLLRRLLGEDIDLVTVLADDLGTVKADAGQIEQVVMNLVVNARDAMPKGGKLTIKTANVELDQAYQKGH